ncbi:hypothetical protein KBP30_02980 [Streptomyces sp. Go40/10]|uniref:hypothetical protein n=1 Tax=Streptomyces sp. Go40/10 TaxID=2825844 RepID=UPI001E303965|nr:hypothetical protein [Streptomyces sp. Go40/10]UFR00206.1 hypothetical protein KBP30_02980 [Streptomyces sp. Go40/10]
MRNSLAAATAAVGMTAALLAFVPATTANAGPMICDPGSHSVDWVTTSRTRVLTHKVKGYEKEYTGGSRTVTKTLEHSKTLTSGRSVDSGASGGFGVKGILISLDAHVNGSYTHEKGRTTTGSVSVSDTLTKKGRYFFYLGRLKASGYWVGYRCDGGTKWIEQAHGRARSYSAAVDGATRCGERVSKKSMADLVQKKYC